MSKRELLDRALACRELAAGLLFEAGELERRAALAKPSTSIEGERK